MASQAPRTWDGGRGRSRQWKPLCILPRRRPLQSPPPRPGTNLLQQPRGALSYQTVHPLVSDMSPHLPETTCLFIVRLHSWDRGQHLSSKIIPQESLPAWRRERKCLVPRWCVQYADQTDCTVKTQHLAAACQPAWPWRTGAP